MALELAASAANSLLWIRMAGKPSQWRIVIPVDARLAFIQCVGFETTFEEWPGKDMPAELWQLVEKVRTDRDKGPWKQLVDCLAANRDLAPPQFQEHLDPFLEMIQEEKTGATAKA
jgi:hypothetical protein